MDIVNKFVAHFDLNVCILFHLLTDMNVPSPNPDPKQLKEYQALTILENAKIDSNNCRICDLF